MRTILKKYPRIKNLAFQLLSIMPPTLKFGNDFFKWYSFFNESEKWSKNEIADYQISRLIELLSKLKQTSCFYKRRLRDINISEIDSLDDFIKKIPSLSKEQFRNNFKEIFSSTIKKKNLVSSKTSGTTGMPLKFYHTADDTAREFAAICHQWNRVGFSPIKSIRAEFRALTEKGKLVEKFPHLNKIRCSIINLKTDNIIYYADVIRSNHIEFLHGYPSAIYLLALEIIRSGIKFPQPKGIMLASEIVYEWQVDRIMEAFPNAKIIAHYGCSERTILAGWCEKRREYHVLPQYSIFEFDRNTSEIIGTNLYNYVNGFVRYRMTDNVIKIDHTTCPDCKREYVPRLIKLGGRKEDFLFSPEKGWIPPAIVTYPLKSLQAIQEIQFYQKEKNELTIRYSAKKNERDLLDNDLVAIKSGILRIFGKNVSVQFKQVEGFERGATGKFKWIVCELDEKPYF